MNAELTEEEMCWALFGKPKSPAPAINSNSQGTDTDFEIEPPAKAAKKKRVS